MYCYHHRRKKDYIFKLVILVSYVLVFSLGFLIAYQTISSPTTPVQIQTPSLTPLSKTYNFSASAPVLAIRSVNNTGVMGRVTIEVRPGKGRVLMDTNPFVEPDTQYSAEMAVEVAQNYTGKNLKDRDAIISFDITGELIGGPSAGASMTVATIASIEEKQVKEDVAITGTIEEDGRIGIIGGIIQKAEAAADNGVKLFLVPETELHLTYYEKQVKKQKIGPGFYIQRVNYAPKTLDLNNYTISEWGMETKGVSTIEDVVGYMLE